MLNLLKIAVQPWENAWMEWGELVSDAIELQMC